MIAPTEKESDASPIIRPDRSQPEERSDDPHPHRNSGAEREPQDRGQKEERPYASGQDE